jgi:ribokinase
MKAAVVGHVEWIDFVRVERVPAPGEIVTALEGWSEAAGGGAMAALEFLRLGAETTFFTAVGKDELGERAERELRASGLRLEVVTREAPQRRGFTFLDGAGERTITVVGEKLVPHGDDPLAWDELASTDAAYFCGGDAKALELLGQSPLVLVATARELPALKTARFELGALVHSGRDPSERFEPGELRYPPRLVATTEGSAGGRFTADGTEGRWAAAPLPGPLVDVYSAGDCFAAGLAYALAEGRAPAEALDFAAQRAALAMTRRGGGTA